MSIKVKVVAMGQKPRDVQLQNGTTVRTLRETNILGIDDIDNKEVLINSAEVPSDTTIRDGDTIIITDAPEGGI